MKLINSLLLFLLLISATCSSQPEQSPDVGVVAPQATSVTLEDVQPMEYQSAKKDVTEAKPDVEKDLLFVTLEMNNADIDEPEVLLKDLSEGSPFEDVLIVPDVPEQSPGK